MYMTPPRRRPQSIWNKLVSAVSSIASTLLDIPSKLIQIIIPPKRVWIESNSPRRCIRLSRATIFSNREMKNSAERPSDQNQLDFGLYNNGRDLIEIEPTINSVNRFAQNLRQQQTYFNNRYRNKKGIKPHLNLINHPSLHIRPKTCDSELSFKSIDQTHNNSFSNSQISNNSLKYRPSGPVREIPPVIIEESNSNFTFKSSPDNLGASNLEVKANTRIKKGKKMAAEKDMFQNQPQPMRRIDFPPNDSNSTLISNAVISQSFNNLSSFQRSIINDYERENGVEIVKRRPPIKDKDQILGEINRKFLREI